MPAKPVDATGERFGSLTAIRNTFTKLPKRRTFVWEFKCDCGSVVSRDLQIIKTTLKNGYTCACNSCNLVKNKEKDKTHGDSRHWLFSRWCKIKSRCNNKEDKDYKSYGAKGVKLEDSFVEYKIFKDYVSSLEGYSKENTLDRIDPEKGYIVGNLRWIPLADQSRNKRDKEGSLPLGVSEKFINGNKYYRASYIDEYGKKFEICRSCKKYGASVALDYVIKWRATTMQYLIALDIGYTENHGNIKEYL